MQARIKPGSSLLQMGIDLAPIGQENFPDQFLRTSGSRTGDEMKVTARAM